MTPHPHTEGQGAATWLVLAALGMLCLCVLCGCATGPTGERLGPVRSVVAGVQMIGLLIGWGIADSYQQPATNAPTGGAR